ncbi:MAG: potassium channel family protein, partial [Planctomycetes bacterium]|nr:potassium channel family protein [Planctomycetota bacterium]
MQSIERQAVIALAGIFLILLFGTCGYMFIQGWNFIDSLYMTTITITTVGYKEVGELSELGRVFTIILILSGISLLAYLSSQFIQFVIQGELSHAFGKRRMKKQISELKGHYIVCGFGRVGKTAALELKERGISVVISECDQKLSEQARNEGYLVVQGDALTDEILIDAGVERAAGVISAVGEDSANLLIALSARELNHDIYIIARGEAPGMDAKLLRAGADVVISPYRITGRE